MSKNTRRKNTRRKNTTHKNTVIYGGGVMDRLKEWFNSSKEKLQNANWFQSAKKNVGDAVDTANNKIGEGFDYAKNSTTSAVSDALSKTSNAMADAAHNVSNTINPTSEESTTEGSVAENYVVGPDVSSEPGPSEKGPMGGRRKRRRKGGANIATNAAPVHGLHVATPTYWIKGGKSVAKRMKRRKEKESKKRKERKSRK